jgi:hypothetical protein
VRTGDLFAALFGRFVYFLICDQNIPQSSMPKAFSNVSLGLRPFAATLGQHILQNEKRNPVEVASSHRKKTMSQLRQSCDYQFMSSRSQGFKTLAYNFPTLSAFPILLAIDTRFWSNVP